MKRKLKNDTICVHAGTQRDPQNLGVNTPIFTSSAFDYRGQAENMYPRYFNTPNQQAVVEKLRLLEKGEDGMVFGSGMAAISTALLSILKPNDHIIFQKGLYGGTHHFIESLLEKWGVSHSFVRQVDRENLEAAKQGNTKAIYIETPSNPLLEIIDLQVVAQFAKDHGLISLIDNTFASPINQTPLVFGFDIVLHSGTKYLAGHSDISFGAVVTSKEIKETMHACAVNLGGSLNASTCYLIERSLKTLSLRVTRQNENALKIAEALAAHPQVEKVYYPGLSQHPGHEIAAQQMTGYGGMLSFELNHDLVLDRYLDQLQLIGTALSLGGVETTICSPSLTSHSKMTAADRQAAGISDGLLRLSVGIEDAQDLIDDLEQALLVSSAVTG